MQGFTIKIAYRIVEPPHGGLGVGRMQQPSEPVIRERLAIYLRIPRR